MYKKRSRGITTNLSDAQIDKLNSIGFVWDAKNDAEWRKMERQRKSVQSKDIWEECFKALIAFKEKTGHTSVPKSKTSKRILLELDYSMCLISHSYAF